MLRRNLGLSPLAPHDERRLESLLIAGRWVLLAGGVGRLLAFDLGDLPSSGVARLVIVYAVIALGNLALMRWLRRAARPSDSVLMALAAWTFDALMVTLLVLTYAEDSSSLSWPLLVLIPVEGAIRFQVPGGLAGWAGALVGYWLSPAAAVPPDGSRLELFLLRMGLVLVLSVVLGLMSRDQVLQRARSRAALDEAERLEEWRTRLISTLAHDLRGPIGTIRSTAQLLQDRDDDLPAATRRDLLAAVGRQAGRVERLTRDLLDLARAEHGTLVVDATATDLGAGVRNAVSLLPGAEVVTVDVPAGLHAVADPVRLEQVLVNLVGNALRHGRPPVTVTASGARDEAADGTVEIRVEDAGPGVPDALRDNLFEPFAAGDGEAAVGLGLWIVRVLVEAHGGSVAYHTSPAGGACFAVRLPAA